MAIDPKNHFLTIVCILGLWQVICNPRHVSFHHLLLVSFFHLFGRRFSLYCAQLWPLLVSLGNLEWVMHLQSSMPFLEDHTIRSHHMLTSGDKPPNVLQRTLMSLKDAPHRQVGPSGVFSTVCTM